MVDKAQLFVDEARKLLGVKWRHRGRSPRGVDCIGLVAVAGQAAQLLAHDESHYGREPWDDRLRKGCRARWGDPVDEPRPGDIAIIRWGKGEPSHMGIIGDRPGGGITLIHSHNLHGVVECTLAGKIKDCVVEVYRPRFA